MPVQIANKVSKARDRNLVEDGVGAKSFKRERTVEDGTNSYHAPHTHEGAERRKYRECKP